MSPDELAAYVRELVDHAPPLTDELRQQVQALLRAPASDLSAEPPTAA